MRLKPLKEQIVVVVGASSGIGRATALAFAARGATVVCAARGEKGLATLVKEIHDRGGKAVAITADAADVEQMKSLAEFAAKKLGRIDTWAHIAAVTVYARFEDTHPAEFARVIEVNLLGQIHGALAALPHLRRTGRGALICVSSVEGHISQPYQSAYAASKHGVVGFLDALRVELEHEGVPISVTNILPAGINTPLFQNALTRLGVEPRPTPPVYAPQLVSRAILYAASTPVRDLVVGGAAKALLLANRISPSIVDAIFRSPIGFESQLSNRPKSPDGPHNLFEPSPARTDRVEGRFSAEAKRRSLITTISLTRGAAVARKVARAIFVATAKVMIAGWTLGASKVERRSPAPKPSEERPRRSLPR